MVWPHALHPNPTVADGGCTPCPSQPRCPDWRAHPAGRWDWNAPFPPRPQGTGRRGIIEYISPEPIQPRALYEQWLLTELIFAK